ncbi:MAG: glutamate-cysteine ligase family protein, partial [Acidobacteriota bacterium]|nr:glutamate-cysteine ligase family protein [Acidobacteriota bacterium]
TVLERMRADHGWHAVGGEPLLELERDGSRITLEPGAQVELSARPFENLADVRVELLRFLSELEEASRDLSIAWLPSGMQPRSRPDEIVVIPKPRYEIMTRYLPTRGDHALWMMRTTAGMQVNLDVLSPAEAARKMRLALRLCPVITGLLANSPLSEGRVNGFLSRRAFVWRDVDPDRCGVPEACIAPGATTADYVDWALDAGMFFIERDGALVDMTGVSFREYLDGGARGHEPAIEDWTLHLTTLFPEARLKEYLEIRCADSNRPDRAMGYVALCVGLFYGDEETVSAAERLVLDWSHEELLSFHERVAREGLRARSPGGRRAGDLARELLGLASATLSRSSAEDRALLAPLEELANSNATPADELLAELA